MKKGQAWFIPDSTEMGVKHVSHFHGLVSAYYPTEETVQQLIDDLVNGIKTAKETKSQVIVEHDCLEHIFVCFPSGSIGLYFLRNTFWLVLPDKMNEAATVINDAKDELRSLGFH